MVFHWLPSRPRPRVSPFRIVIRKRPEIFCERLLPGMCSVLLLLVVGCCYGRRWVDLPFFSLYRRVGFNLLSLTNPSSFSSVSNNKMSIESGERTFYYMTRESLCFLAMTESKYPKRTGFLYLDEVCDLILQELIREYGNNVSVSMEMDHE